MRRLIATLCLCIACESTDDPKDAAAIIDSGPEHDAAHDAAPEHDAASQDGSADAGELDAATPDAATPDAGPPRACAEREPAACEADALCRTIGGARAGEDFAGSSDGDLPLGCMDSDGDDCGDGDAVTCAYDGASGPAFRFRTTCIPRNWVALDYATCEQESAAPPCETRSLDDCDVALCQVREARPAGAPDGTREPVACMNAELSCGAEETCGENPEGERYVFPDTCLPAGWSELGYPACE